MLVIHKKSSIKGLRTMDKKIEMTLQEYCTENNLEALLEQWDAEKNAPLSPETVSASTHKKMWWRDAYGHEWTQPVYSRTVQKRGCPICANRVVLPGFNDLAATHPALASEWDTEKNGTLTPQQVFAGSGVKVWWRCKKGHSWKAVIASRAGGCSCPVCANRIILPGFNDFATTHPVLAAEWDKEKNGDLTPQRISYGYDKKVWWRCSLGHEWKAAPSSRIRMAAGCPICSGHAVQKGYNDLETLYPLVAAEWNYEKNDALMPDQVVAGSNRLVWWCCSLGHEWRAAIVDRTAGTNGCPYCSNRKVLAGFNDLATLEPEIAAQWHPTLNGELLPTQLTAGSSRRIWWICSEGHVWRTSVANRTNAKKRTGCPVCAGNISKQNALYYQKMAAQSNNCCHLIGTERNDSKGSERGLSVYPELKESCHIETKK